MNGAARLHRWAPWIVLLVALLAYANSFRGPFLFDDRVIITQNPDLYRLAPRFLSTRMLTDLSFKLNYAVGQHRVGGYHAVNLAIHMLAGLLLYGVVRISLEAAGRAAVSAQRLALACAALWVVHPLQTESVTYVCQRYECMLGLFYLSVLYCFARGAVSARPRPWFDATIVFCALGMAVKEVMVSAPVVVLAYDRLVICGSWREVFRKRGKVHACLFGSWGILVLLWLSTAGAAAAAGARLVSEVTPWRYLLTQCGVILHYLRLSVIPHPLVLDYGWGPAPFDMWLLFAAAGVVGLGCLTLWAWRQRPPLAFLGVAFFAVLAPTSSLLPVPDMAAEHRMYLPLAPVLVLLAVAANTVVSRLGSRRGRAGAAGVWLTAATVCVAALLMVLTHLRNRDYATEERMWASVIRGRPGNPRGHLGLALTWIDAGRLDEAETLVGDALGRLPPERADAPRRDRTTRSQAYAAMGTISSRRGDSVTAVERLRDALRVASGNFHARSSLGVAFWRQGREEEAIDAWEQVLLENPRHAVTRSRLGSLLATQGRAARAVRELDEALRLQPQLREARLSLAWLLSTSPDDGVRDGDRALRLLAPLSSERGPASVQVFDALAAASAETGRFDQALRYVRQALSEGTDAGMDGLEVIEGRRVAYAQGRPYRDRRRPHPQ